MNALLLEHVNLNVPNRAVAKQFWVNAIGGAIHPRGTRKHQLHVNLGISQVHLPFADTPPDGVGEPVVDLEGGSDSFREAVVADGSPYVGEAQLLRGSMTLWVRSAEKARIRLHAAAESTILSETAFAFEDEGGALIRTRCPFGNTVLLREASGALANELERLGAHAGGGGENPLAIASVAVPIPVGMGQPIADFYTDFLGLAASTTRSAATAAAATETETTISVGPHQELVFTETKDAPDPDEYWKDRRVRGWHLCLYVRDWATAKKKCFDGGAARESDRYAALDRPLEDCQFRLFALPGGLALEHEVRSPRAPMCPLHTKK